jgi:DNA-binding transcriptional regulator YhcF (GntR family)
MPADLGDLTVDRRAEVPIGVQLAWALRSRIGDGQLKAGQRLPGLRELADTIGVNVNTVRAVYQRLEQDGLIASLQGSGTFVTATAASSSTVGTIAASAAREALQTGVDPRAVAAALYMSSEDQAPAATQERAERRRMLRTQIAELERALSEIEASHPGIVPRAETAGALIGPSLLSAPELEQVRAALVRRLATVQSAIDEQAEIQVAHARQDAAAAQEAAARRAELAKSAKRAVRAKAEDGTGAPATRKRKPRGNGKPAPASA